MGRGRSPLRGSLLGASGAVQSHPSGQWRSPSAEILPPQTKLFPRARRSLEGRREIASGAGAGNSAVGGSSAGSLDPSSLACAAGLIVSGETLKTEEEESPRDSSQKICNED